MAKVLFPPAPTDPPRRSPFGLLVTGVTINILLSVGLYLTSLLLIPYLPSFLWGSVEVAWLMATGGPEAPRTELGRWYARYQEAQDGSLDRLIAVSDPLPLGSLDNPDLFGEAAERDALRPELGAYVEELRTWDDESQKQLEASLAELDSLKIPPGSAAWVRSVIGPLEGEYIDRQTAWATAEAEWVVQVVDLYDWLEIAERRGAQRFAGERLSWLSGGDQQAYQSRLDQIHRFEWQALSANQRLTNWTAAQNPEGLWFIFINWVRGYGLVPPLAPEPPEFLA